MIKILLMYSIFTVTSFVIGWVSQDFHYTTFVSIMIIIISYFLYDEWIRVLKKGIKKESCDNRTQN